MKRILIFILLKVFELTAFVGLVVGFAYWGRFVKTVFPKYYAHSFLDNNIFLGELLIGIPTASFLIVICVLIGAGIYGLIKKNWEWLSKEEYEYTDGVLE